MFSDTVETSSNRIACEIWLEVVLSSPTGAAARPRHPPVPPAPSTPVRPGVLLCLLAPHPACIRYKVRPAWLVAGGSGRKFAMRAQNARKWAFSGEQGEFCTARGVRRGPQGEFCTAHAVRRGVLGEFCTAVAPPLYPVVEILSPAAPRRAVALLQVPRPTCRQASS